MYVVCIYSIQRLAIETVERVCETQMMSRRYVKLVKF